MTEVKAKVEIDLDGHVACIEDITGSLVNGEVPEILFHLSFEKPVGNCVRFPISIPARNYSQGLLLVSIIEEGKKRVREILADYESGRIRNAAQEEMQKKLEYKVAEYKAMVGLG